MKTRPKTRTTWLSRSLVVALALTITACSGGPIDSDSSPKPDAPKPASTMVASTGEPTEVANDGTVEETDVTPASTNSAAKNPSTDVATFGAGCFWCVEAVLEQLDGVSDVTSGYMGGDVDDPTYQAVCSGTSGHAEVVQVTFDPSVLSYDKLVDWFWELHDPTTLNRQGADSGTQYRSAIFYHSDAQRVAAEASKVRAQSKLKSPIVTEITKAGEYFMAEAYHQDYYRLNKEQGYSRAVIAPKLKKLDLEE